MGSFGALCQNWPLASKRATVEQNGVKFGSRGHIWGTFDLLPVKVILGSFGALLSKSEFCIVVNGKMTEIWDSGVLAQCVWGTFDLPACKVILGSFGALSKISDVTLFETLLLLCFLMFLSQTFFTAF